MERAAVNGINLEYRVSGMGEPVVFIHGAFIADSFGRCSVRPVWPVGFSS